MDVKEFCTDCSQNKECKSIYQKLGHAKGPPIWSKIIIAFVLPLMVFIGCLALFDQIFSKTIDTKQLNILLSFLSALAITFAFILTLKLLNRHSCKSR